MDLVTFGLMLFLPGVGFFLGWLAKGMYVASEMDHIENRVWDDWRIGDRERVAFSLSEWNGLRNKVDV